MVQVSPALLAYIHRVRLGMNAGFLILRTYTSAGAGPLVVCSLLLSSFSLCLWCVGFEICLYSHFEGVLEGFPCWMYACIARVLCVACGAFVCVRG